MNQGIIQITVDLVNLNVVDLQGLDHSRRYQTEELSIDREERFLRVNIPRADVLNLEQWYRIGWLVHDNDSTISLSQDQIFWYPVLSPASYLTIDPKTLKANQNCVQCVQK